MRRTQLLKLYKHAGSIFERDEPRDPDVGFWILSPQDSKSRLDKQKRAGHQYRMHFALFAHAFLTEINCSWIAAPR
jgi:hypothetical protein